MAERSDLQVVRFAISLKGRLFISGWHWINSKGPGRSASFTGLKTYSIYLVSSSFRFSIKSFRCYFLESSRRMFKNYDETDNRISQKRRILNWFKKSSDRLKIKITETGFIYFRPDLLLTE